MSEKKEGNRKNGNGLACYETVLRTLCKYEGTENKEKSKTIKNHICSPFVTIL